MSECHKELIRLNITKLCDSTICTVRLLDRCWESRIMTSVTRSKIDEEKQLYSRNRLFYENFRCLDIECLAQLVTIMEEPECLQDKEVIRTLRITPKINSSSLTSAVYQTNVWFEVPDLIHGFCGRDKELGNLHKQVLINYGKESPQVTLISQTTAVSGLEGIGKTSLLIVFAHKYAKDFDRNIIWINAGTKALMIGSFHRLAIKLGVNSPDLGDKPSEQNYQVLIRIYNHFSNRKSLFIFNNAVSIDGFDSVLDFFPKCTQLDSYCRPHILLTTRVAHLITGAVEFKLNVLDEAAAVQFFVSKLKVNESESVKHRRIFELLVQKLHCIPLALQQSSDYVREVQIQTRGIKEAVVNFIKKFDSRSIFYVSEEPFLVPLFTICDMGISLIANEPNGSTIIAILKMLAYFDCDNILCDVFKYPGFPGNSISILSKYSMIDINGKFINVHKIVQTVIREKNHEEEECTLRGCLNLMKWFADKVSQGLIPHIPHLNTQHKISIWTNALKHQSLIDEFPRFGLILCSFADEANGLSFLHNNGYNDNHLYTEILKICSEGSDAFVDYDEFKLLSMATLISLDVEDSINLKEFTQDTLLVLVEVCGIIRHHISLQSLLARGSCAGGNTIQLPKQESQTFRTPDNIFRQLVVTYNKVYEYCKTRSLQDHLQLSRIAATDLILVRIQVNDQLETKSFYQEYLEDILIQGPEWFEQSLRLLYEQLLRLATTLAVNQPLTRSRRQMLELIVWVCDFGFQRICSISSKFSNERFFEFEILTLQIRFECAKELDSSASYQIALEIFQLSKNRPIELVYLNVLRYALSDLFKIRMLDEVKEFLAYAIDQCKSRIAQASGVNVDKEIKILVACGRIEEQLELQKK